MKVRRDVSRKGKASIVERNSTSTYSLDRTVDLDSIHFSIRRFRSVDACFATPRDQNVITRVNRTFSSSRKLRSSETDAFCTWPAKRNLNQVNVKRLITELRTFFRGGKTRNRDNSPWNWMILRYWINSKTFSPATPRSYRENVMEACHCAPYAKLYRLEEPSIVARTIPCS